MIAHFARSFLVLAFLVSCASAATSSLDTVDITATGVTAQEGGTPGKFLLHRSGSTGTLVVNLVLDGVDSSGKALPATGAASYSAVGGPTGVAISSTSDMDYGLELEPSTKSNGATTSLPTLSSGGFSVTFASGQQDITILVNAYEDGVKEGQEYVKMRFLQDPSYIIGVGSVATVTIADDDILATLGMPDQTLSEFYGDPSPEGNFEILFNDVSFSRYLVFSLSGTATRNADYLPQAMYLHQPSGGELASMTLNNVVVAYSFTPSGATSALSGQLSGGGWYVNVPPAINFDPVSDANRVSVINQLRITASNTAFPAGTTIALNALGVSSLDKGKPARGYGYVDKAGQLVSVKLIDAGVFAKSDITGLKSSLVITYGSGSATASIDASVPSGSDAAGAAYLNGMVTDVTVLSSGSGYSSATVGFINAPGDTTGTGATATVKYAGTTIDKVIVTNPGYGYTRPPTVVISGDGSGASAVATIEGPVNRVDVTNVGLGYHVKPSFMATRSSLSVPASKVFGGSLADVSQSDFSSTFNSRVHNPDFFNRRSSGPDFRVQIPWTAKLDTTDTNSSNYNKKGKSILSGIAGNGPLTIGDVITIGASAQLYAITGKSLPSPGSIYYKFTVSPALQADVADDAVITNAPSINLDVQPYSIPAMGTVGYFALHAGITPVDDTLAEGAETVSLLVLANNDFQIQNPTVQTMQIADDDVIADIKWINNGSEPNLSGQARVTISKPLDKDVTIPFLITGSATPGAGLTTDPVQTTTGNQKQDEANKSDYVITGITDIVPPIVDPTGALVTPASARGSVTISKGHTYVDIIVGVQNDPFPESSEYVTITLQRTDDVVLAGSPGSGSNPSATINIADNLGMVSVGYSVDGKESPTSPTAGAIRFVVDGNKGITSTNISVGFTVGGSATYNSDFIFGGSAFTVDPSAGKGFATLKAQEPVWITAVSGATVTAVSGNGLASVANGSVVVIGGASYTVKSGGGTIPAGAGTNLVLDRAVEEAIAGTALTITGDTPADSLGIQVSAAQAVNIAPKTGLVINGRIYIAGSFKTEALLQAPTTLTLSQGLQEAIPKNTPVYLALRPVSELLIQVKDDLVAEGTEAVLVNLVAGSAYSISSVASSASASILDDEPVISVTALSAAYEPNVDGLFRISYAGTALNRSISVNFGITTPSSGKNAAGVPIQTDGTTGTAFSIDAAGIRHYYATPGLDYQAIAQTVIIPAGSTSVEIPVFITADAEVEQVEEVEMYLIAPSDQSYALDSGTASVSIYDAPALSVKVIQDAAEGGQPGKIRFTRASTGSVAGFNGAIHVSAQIMTGTTAVPDVVGASSVTNDFPVVSNSFLSQPGGVGTTVLVNADIPAGQASVDVTIPVSDDQVADRGEIIIVGILPSKEYKIDSTANSATIAIVDNEPAVVLSAMLNANEGGVSGQIKIALAPPVPSSHTAFKVPISLSGDASWGSDYTVSGQTVDPTTQTMLVDIPANQDSVILTIVPRTANGVTDPIRQVIATVRLGRSDVGSGPLSADASQTASINILDDLPIISLVRVPTTNDTDLAEPNVSGRFRILASVVPVSDLTVNFTLGGTATLNKDYTIANPTQAVIKANTSSVDVVVDPVDDLEIEGIEGIDISLAPNGVKYAIDPAKGALTLLIGDNESTGGVPLVSVKADDAMVNEEKQKSGTFTLSRTFQNGPMIVSFALTGTATTADYTISGTDVAFDAASATGTVTFKAGDASSSIIVTPIDDAVAEGIETVILTIIPRKIYNITERSSASMEIADNDILTSLTIIDPSASESNGKSAVFRVNSTPSNIDRQFTIDVTGTAVYASSGGDYILSTRLPGSSVFTPLAIGTDPFIKQTIPAGSEYMEFQLTPVDDSLAEGRETAIFTLHESNQFALGSPRAGLITIADNDVNLTLTAKDGGEPSTSGSFHLKLSAPLPVDTEVAYTVGGTATPDSDYVALRQIVILKNTVDLDIPVVVKPDLEEEYSETVKLILSSSLDYVVSGSATATVNIAEYLADVSVTPTGSPADETGLIGGFVVTANRQIRKDGTQPGFSVAYELSGSAIMGIDFERPASYGQLSFPQNATVAFISIVPVDDSIAEGDETIELKLLDGPGYKLISNAKASTLTIKDDEPVLSLTKIRDGAEPNDSASFLVSYSGYPVGKPLSRAVKVFYHLVNTSTATAGKDFVLPSILSAEIPAGGLSTTIDFPVLDDVEVEKTETITIALDTGSSYSVDPNFQTATANIIDDEPVVSVDATVNASEPATNGFFTVSYPGTALSRSIDVSFALSGTATPANGSLPGDYSVASGYVGVRIPAYQNSVQVPVTVVEDKLIEGPETVVLTLASTGSGYRVDATKASATLTINDDDVPVISIIGQSNPPAEKPNKNGKFTLQISPVYGAPLTVKIAPYIQSGALAAVPNVDFIDLKSTYTIPANTDKFEIDVVVLPDNTPGENLKFASYQILPDPQYFISAKSTDSVVIKDGPPVLVSIGGVSDATEGGAAGQAVVTLSNYLNVALKIPLSVSGTAAPGSDYAALGSEVVIPAGQTSAVLTVSPVADGILEPDETVEVTLSPGADANLYTLTNRFATVKIKSPSTDAPPTGSLVGADNGKSGGCGAGGGIALFGLVGLFLFWRRRTSE